MPIKADIVNFLRTNVIISKINFDFGGFKVYPTAYSKDVADAIDAEHIKINMKGASSAAAGATYDMAYDSLELKPTFTITNASDQAFLVHESTHAHLDIQNIGTVTLAKNEGVGYLAEAIFIEANGWSPLSSATVRTVAHTIAGKVLKGTYFIDPADVLNLMSEVSKHPHYAAKPPNVLSEGFKRGIMQNIFR